MVADCSLICEKCFQKLLLAFDLKSVCVCNEDFITPFKTDKPDGSDKLVKAYLKKNNLNFKFFPDQLRICRFCITVVVDHDCFSLDDIEIDRKLGQTIKTYIPEVVSYLRDSFLII